jgi:hypothetical protein
VKLVRSTAVPSALVCFLAASACKKSGSLSDPLAPTALYTEAEVQAQFLDRSGIVPDESGAQFTLSVPKDWQPDPMLTLNTNPTSGDLVLIARYQPADKSATLDVSFERLRHEISLGDFVDVYLHAHNIEVLGRRSIIDPQNELVEDVFLRDRDEDSFVARMRFKKDGARIFSILGGSGESDYSELIRPFARAVASFNLVPRSLVPYAEPFPLYVADDRIGPSFHYPASWQLRPAKDAPEGCGAADVALTEGNLDRTLLRVKWARLGGVHHASAGKMIEKFSDEMSRAGCDRLSLESTEPWPGYPATPPSGLLYTWNAEANGESLILKEVAFESPTVVCAASLTAPTPDRDPEGWAAGLRAFEIAGEDLVAFVEKQ